MFKNFNFFQMCYFANPESLLALLNKYVLLTFGINQHYTERLWFNFFSVKNVFFSHLKFIYNHVGPHVQKESSCFRASETHYQRIITF